MYIGKRAIDSGVAVLVEAGICDKYEAINLVSRVFKEMMKAYSSESQLISYSPSPQPQRGVL